MTPSSALVCDTKVKNFASREGLPASTECYGALWDTLPELGIVPENNASTGGFERLQPIKRCHHCFAVENIARQTSFMERLAKVAGICRKHGIATGQPYPERLVTRRVAVGGHAYDRTIAENVVFAVYKSKAVANIVIAGIVAVRYGNIGI